MPPNPTVPRRPQECTTHERHRNYSSCQKFQSSQFTKNAEFSYFYRGANSDIACITMSTPEPAKLVAIKRIRPTNQQDPSEFIRNELMIWSILNTHQHIVSLMGLTSIADLDYLWGKCLGPLAVCNYYEKQSLKEFLCKENPDRNSRVELLSGVIQGLAHIHNKEVVHGDLKMANVAVAVEKGQLVAKITDFGSSSLKCWCYQNPNEINGTSFYDSPELLEEMPRTAGSDVWAFGCVILEVYANVYPFTGPSYSMNNVNMNPARLTTLQLEGALPGTELDFDLTDEVSRSMWEVAQMCWKSEPAKRPKAAELVQLMDGIDIEPDEHQVM